MTSVTLKINQDILNKMNDFYKEIIVLNDVNKGNYIVWSAKTIDDVVITIYSSNKGTKALFTGENALNEARIWDKNAVINIPKEKIKAEWLSLDDQIGSDEVGTGDFFGPVVVVASYVSKNDIEWLRSLKVNDSKKLTDEKIKEIAPELMKKITYIKQICSPVKYNEQIKKGQSMNSIKALLHNNALRKVRNKVGEVPCFVDQFCDVDKYYYYLIDQKEIVNKRITFRTKGESFYPSVAVSSIIARYLFLKEIELMSASLNTDIPLGASIKVDECAKKLVNKFGKEKLEEYCKINFVNYKNL